MKRKNLFRHVIVMGVSVVVVLAMAVPASAIGTLDGVIAGGMAEVGKWFTDDCDKSGKAAVTGKGLYFPEFGEQGVNRERDAVYHLETEVSAVGATANQDSMTADAGIYIGTLEVCGWITSLKGTNDLPGTGNGTDERTNGIGAACGASKGHHGRGTATVENLVTGILHKVKLYDLGWISAVGGALPVTGRFQEYEPDSETVKKDKYGEVVALIQASGTAGLGEPTQLIENCSGAGDGNGAQEFAVNGVFSLINTVIQPPKTSEVGKDDTVTDNSKDCKGTGPEAPIGPDGKKQHNNKPGDVACPKGTKPAS